MRVYSLIILAFFLCSCSDQNKAKRAIKEELKLTLHDFSSYEPVQYGNLEVAFSSVEDLPEFKECLNQADIYTKRYTDYKDKSEIYEYDYYGARYQMYHKLYMASLDSSITYLQKAELIETNFTPVVMGWKLTHSYRAKNLAGNLGIHHYVIYLDKELNKVIKTVDISENSGN